MDPYFMVNSLEALTISCSLLYYITLSEAIQFSGTMLAILIYIALFLI